MIDSIRSAFRVGQVTWRLHALQRMLERNISRADVARAIENGEIIETYPDGKPFPAGLCLGFSAERPIHVVLAWDAEAQAVYVVTVYEPDLDHFGPDFKSRRV